MASIPSSRGSMLLQEPVLGHRIGWFQSGLVFAEGHPRPDESLCPPSELVPRTLELQEALLDRGLPLPTRERGFDSLDATSEGWAGLRRADLTVNFDMPDTSTGLAVLAGIAACVRDAPGKGNVRYGQDRGVETVYMHGYAGKAVLGRWYDKALEAVMGPRATLIRGEDQRRWPKGQRRDPQELTADACRRSFQKRFYPLYRATKGVTVVGAFGIAQKIAEAVESGEIGVQRARLLVGDVVLESVGADVLIPKRTRQRSRRLRGELGLVLADGVLDEVEVDVGSVLEAALETDVWERQG